MITKSEWQEARLWAWELVQKAGIPVNADEFEQVEVADLGLSELETTGLQILTLSSTEWVGVKLLILRPDQFFPQHRHPPSATTDYPGKQEIFRGAWGEAFLYVPGEPTTDPQVAPPAHRSQHLTVWHEVSLQPGDQHLVPSNQWHWFQAGPEGAVVWSFSSKVTDSQDQFMDPAVDRQTVIVEHEIKAEPDTRERTS